MAAEGGKVDPMHQFLVEPLFGQTWNIAGYPIPFTNSALWMAFTLLAVTIFMMGGLKRDLVPGRWQMAVESVTGAISGMVDQSIGLGDPLQVAGRQFKDAEPPPQQASLGLVSEPRQDVGAREHVGHGLPAGVRVALAQREQGLRVLVEGALLPIDGELGTELHARGQVGDEGQGRHVASGLVGAQVAGQAGLADEQQAVALLGGAQPAQAVLQATGQPEQLVVAAPRQARQRLGAPGGIEAVPLEVPAARRAADQARERLDEVLQGVRIVGLDPLAEEQARELGRLRDLAVHRVGRPELVAHSRPAPPAPGRGRGRALQALAQVEVGVGRQGGEDGAGDGLGGIPARERGVQPVEGFLTVHGVVLRSPGHPMTRELTEA